MSLNNTSLSDGYGRVIQNLRISITDRCNLRCVYCMPESPDWMAHPEILSYEELYRLVHVFVELGVSKVRITGGEPTLRRNMVDFVSTISKTKGLNNVGVTTNGLLLNTLAKPLYDGGLRKLNVSLDTLKRERFKSLTRRDSLDRVLQGLEAAKKVGFESIKVNCVVIKGMNDDEVVPFIEFGREHGYEVRFIEFMPLDADDVWEKRRVFTQQEMLDVIGPKYPFERVTTADPHAPATRFCFDDTGELFGIIASVSQPFCTKCDRVRLTADGKFRTCLFSTRETDLKTPLRRGATDEELSMIIRESVTGKEPGHFINSDNFEKPTRTMHRIGG